MITRTQNPITKARSSPDHYSQGRVVVYAIADIASPLRKPCSSNIVRGPFMELESRLTGHARKRLETSGLKS